MKNLGKKMQITFNEYYKKIQKLASEQNINITQQREFILKILFDCDIPIDVNAIQKSIIKKYKCTITSATIYKFLNILETLSVLHVMILPPNKTKRYALNHIKSQNYLICVKCGQIINFYDSIMQEQLKQNLENKNFLLLNHRVIFYGLCKECV